MERDRGWMDGQIVRWERGNEGMGLGKGKKGQIIEQQ